jgi:hypothetical protein
MYDDEDDKVALSVSTKDQQKRCCGGCGEKRSITSLEDTVAAAVELA